MSEEESKRRGTGGTGVQSVDEASTTEELRAISEALEKRTAELADEKRLLERLNRVGQSIASILDRPTLLQRITDAATELSGASFGAFFYNAVGADGDTYQLYALSGAPREAFEGFGTPRATPLFGPTFRGEAVVRCDDVTKDGRYGLVGPHHGMPAGHLPVRSYLAVPVTSRSGEVLGGLFFGDPAPGVFDERAERLVVGVAAYAALALDNARLYEQMRQAAEERARALVAERETRAELERVSVLKDEFLSTLSHELRTPLNAVLGWSEVLLARRPDAETRKGLETISRNARAQGQMIEDLLDMNRIISGKMRLEVQTVDIVAVIEAAVESVRPSAEAKQIRLRHIVDPDAGPVIGDPSRIQQIVWNLISNAVKFTPKQGKVDVLVERVNSHIEITVRDTGIGIEPEFMPHLFERFRQTDASTSRRYGGLGMGLSIVKQLVELHGGTVSAESAGAGKGSRFCVALPRSAVRPDPAREHPTGKTRVVRHDQGLLLSGVKVLIVEDETDARQFLRLALESRDAEVVSAASADEALTLLSRERPDVLVSDIGMPLTDGYRLMRAVRALPGIEARTPAVALTAFARSEDRTRAMLAGYNVHVAKPVELDELVATVASLVGRTGRPASG